MQLHIWESLRERLRTKVSPIVFHSCFKQVPSANLEGDALTLTVPNRFIADWIQDYYLDLLQEELVLLCERNLSVRLAVQEDGQESELRNGVSQTNGSKIGQTDTAKASTQIGHPSARMPAGLNPKYTFQNFVVGSGNQLAHAAALAVADLPGGHYNPLFIYGGVGLGKTHLLNAVRMGIAKKYPHLKIIYGTAEKFMNEFISCIRFEKMGEFRRKYRDSCDLLLIDDVQFLSGKESTQEEFFHTFNVLYDVHKQIILTSDKIPKEIPGIEERLCSRFEWGLIADIQPPDLETRIAILKKKADAEGILLPDEAAILIASQVKSNVRELEGILIRLHAFAKLMKAHVTTELASEVLKNLSPASGGRTSFEEILRAVADYYQITIQDLKSPRRHKSLARPRQIAMYLCKKYLKASYPEIGVAFGGRDHTTIIHGVRKVESLLLDNNVLKEEVELLEKSILK